jgi:hypothetical protein
MIRNLKVMLLAALAVTAFGVFAASAAQAAQFTAPLAGAGATTTIKPAKDGTGKTSHHVFDIGNTATTSNVSFTCEEITGTGTAVGPASEEVLFTTPGYNTCNAGGQAVTVQNTGCNFRFTASGLLHIVSEAGHNCAHGAEPIDITFAGCKVEVGAQTIEGIKYHNLNAAGTTVGSGEGSKVTIEPVINTKIVYNAKGANCEYGTTSNGTYTTGNTIVTGEREGKAVEVRWDA